MKYVWPLCCSALAIGAALLLLECFWTAIRMPDRCGIEYDASMAVILVFLFFPLTFFVAGVAAISGYLYPRWTFIVHAALIVVCLAVIGIIQAVPHFDHPPNSWQCRFDM